MELFAPVLFQNFNKLPLSVKCEFFWTSWAIRVRPIFFIGKFIKILLHCCCLIVFELRGFGEYNAFSCLVGSSAINSMRVWVMMARPHGVSLVKSDRIKTAWFKAISTALFFSSVAFKRSMIEISTGIPR